MVIVVMVVVMVMVVVNSMNRSNLCSGYDGSIYIDTTSGDT